LNCAPEIRARLSVDPNAAIVNAPVAAAVGATSQPQAPPSSVSTPNYYAPPPTSPTAPQASYDQQSTAALAKARVEDRLNLVKGLAVGLGIGIVGSILTLKLLFYAHFGLSYIYIAVGYGIGAGIWHFTNRGGTQLAFASVGVMIFSLAVAHLVYAADVLGEVRAAGNADPGVTLFDALPVAMSTFSPMHWVCIAIGVAACWGAAHRQPS
jgi:hypothetical protein